MVRTQPWAAALLLLAMAVAAACQPAAEPGADAARSPMDTTDTAGANGLSTQQIEQRAEAMSPARAESLGIVDTTIHLEELTTGDSLTIRAVVPESVP